MELLDRIRRSRPVRSFGFRRDTMLGPWRVIFKTDELEGELRLAAIKGHLLWRCGDTRAGIQWTSASRMMPSMTRTSQTA